MRKGRLVLVALALVAQRTCGCLIPENAQDQVGWALSNLVEWKMSLIESG